MENQHFFTIKVQFRPRDLVIYSQYIGPRVKKDNLAEEYARTLGLVEEKEPKERNIFYTGKFSSSARRNMAQALDCLIMLSPVQTIFNPVINKSHTFQLNFITLTMSCVEIVDYSVAIKMLEQFNKFLLRQLNCHMYVWRLELQKRGQIHFHILTDAFIHYAKIRDFWNGLQRRFGLIERGMNPNSTDVTSALSISDVAAYCRKYMQKEDTNFQNYTGSKISKFWGCSLNLRGVHRPVFDWIKYNLDISELQKELNNLCPNSFEPSGYCVYYHNRDNKTKQSVSKFALKHLKLEKEFRIWQKNILPLKFIK